jgi:hypothetical protein
LAEVISRVIQAVLGDLIPVTKYYSRAICLSGPVAEVFGRSLSELDYAEYGEWAKNSRPMIAGGWSG